MVKRRKTKKYKKRDPERSKIQRKRRNLKIDDEGRQCTLCDKYKTWDNFFKNEKGANGYQSRCIPCYRKKQKEYRRKNKKHVRRLQHNSMLKRQYGITRDEYDKLKGKTKCWICGGGSAVNLAVDHNHSNGNIRGLLCKPCNRILGHWRDEAWKAEAAREYLEDDGKRVSEILGREVKVPDEETA